jgi:hypothetical protein
MEMHFPKNTKHVTGIMNSAKRRRDGMPIAVAMSLVFFSLFSLLVVSVQAKNSDGLISSGRLDNVPQITMTYDNKIYPMSTFVLANSGEMKKIAIPSALPAEDGSNPPVNIQLGDTVHFQFNKEPSRVSAYLIDMEAQPVELYAQRQIGSNDFQIVGPEGILNYELHAYFPDGQYTSQYLLVNVTSGASPSVRSFSEGQSGAEPGYIALSDKEGCDSADRLHTLQISAKSQKTNSSSPITLLDNNMQTTWTVKSTDVKSFVKSGSNDDEDIPNPSNAGQWLQLDLGAEKMVCNIGIAFPNGDKSINFFSVQASADGEHFKSVGVAESTPLSAGGQLFTFPDMPDKARYIRISDVGNIISDQTQIAEIMAAGK